MGQTCSYNGSKAGILSSHERLPIPGGPASPRPSSLPEILVNRGNSSQRLREPPVPLHIDNFAIRWAGQDSGPVAAAARITAEGWKQFYSLGPALGDGVSAMVFEAEAVGKAKKDPTTQPWAQSVLCGGFATTFVGGCTVAPLSCSGERIRRVAIKRFHRTGSQTFQKELSALLRVGVHPHLLRLLESFENIDGEDVLVLEYCDGLTVYDLYAREHRKGGLVESLICLLMRQLLQALEHLSSYGVDHQDVKPENMMLFDVSYSPAHAELKLGDFGWAKISSPTSTAPKTPMKGAGSLWYAPPELNPPTEKTARLQTVVSDGLRPIGRSDMWSAGVVTYLLLVGHNPFNEALKLRDPTAVETQVLKLVALGQFNARSEKWARLRSEARDLVTVLLQVDPIRRPSASDALQHPWIANFATKQQEVPKYVPEPVSWQDADRYSSWNRLDGLQHLGWLAVARAVSETEIERQVVTAALNSATAARAGGHPSVSYLDCLSRELGTLPVGHWLLDRSTWNEVVRLAFRYLDCDADGLLSPRDLASHAGTAERDGGDAMRPANDVLVAAKVWVSKWQEQGSSSQVFGHGELSSSMRGSGVRQNTEGISITAFRVALSSSAESDLLPDTGYGEHGDFYIDTPRSVVDDVHNGSADRGCLQGMRSLPGKDNLCLDFRALESKVHYRNSAEKEEVFAWTDLMPTT